MGGIVAGAAVQGHTSSVSPRLRVVLTAKGFFAWLGGTQKYVVIRIALCGRCFCLKPQHVTLCVSMDTEWRHVSILFLALGSQLRAEVNNLFAAGPGLAELAAAAIATEWGSCWSCAGAC